MLFGPQRGSVLTIFDKFAGTFGIPIAVVVIALVFKNMQALLENGIVLAIVLLAPISRLFNYFFTYYSIDEDKFHVKSGFLNKKELEIPLDRITAVDFTQNIIFQWAGAYSIKIDNASNYGGNGAGTVTLALKKDDAIRMKALLLSKRKETAETTEQQKPLHGRNSIKVPMRNIVIMGALQAKGNALAQVISIFTVLGSVMNIIVGHEVGFEERLLDILMEIPGIGIAAMLMAAFVIISTALGAIFAFIKYYGFRITDGEKSIYLEYGLFTKKTHSLLKEKISGVEFVQSLPMRLFKKGYLNVLAVGYGDKESSEKAMMYPFIGEYEALGFVSGYISEIEISEAVVEKPLGRSIGYFFICPRVFFAIIFLIAAAICRRVADFSLYLDWVIWIFIFFLFLAAASAVMEYMDTDVRAGDRCICFTVGGFTRIRTAIRTQMLESVSDSATILKRRKGIISIKLGILAPEMDSVKTVRNMHFGALKAIQSVMRY